jgi:transcriptional regulator with XRE-family HTH domain
MARKAKTNTQLGKRVGGNVKRARVQAGLTQSQLAEMLGLEVESVSRIETGAQLPSLERLNEVAQILNLTLVRLLGDSGGMNAFGELVVVAIADLPQKQQEFVYSFALAYAQHYRSNLD